MDQYPLVSVIITVYNREKYLAEAIESVLNSSFHDFELIIVDDHSTDTSFNIAESYNLKDKRIRLYRNEKNLGQFDNRNYAASLANGKYIKFLDSDDIIYPHGLELMVSAMQKYPEAGIGFNDLHNKKNNFPDLYNSTKCYIVHFFKKGLLYHGPTGCIYKNEAFKNIGCFNPQYGVAGDYEFNLRMTQKYDAVIFENNLYKWRTHENQEFNKFKNDYALLFHKINLKYLTDINCPLGHKAKKALHNHLAIKTRKILLLLLKLKFSEAYQNHKLLSLKFQNYYWSISPSFLR